MVQSHAPRPQAVVQAVLFRQLRHVSGLEGCSLQGCFFPSSALHCLSSCVAGAPSEFRAGGRGDRLVGKSYVTE